MKIGRRLTLLLLFTNLCISLSTAEESQAANENPTQSETTLKIEQSRSLLAETNALNQHQAEELLASQPLIEQSLTSPLIVQGEAGLPVVSSLMNVGVKVRRAKRNVQHRSTAVKRRRHKRSVVVASKKFQLPRLKIPKINIKDLNPFKSLKIDIKKLNPFKSFSNKSNNNKSNNNNNQSNNQSNNNNQYNNGQYNNDKSYRRREQEVDPFDPKNQLVKEPMYTFSVLEPFENDTMSGSPPQNRRLVNGIEPEAKHDDKILESDEKSIMI
jgi:hypothetical protein